MAIDTAAKGAAGDPVIRKPTAILPAEGGEKFHCNLAGSTRLIEVVTHIEECLRSANPAFADAWNGKTRSGKSLHSRSSMIFRVNDMLNPYFQFV